ncbi:MAG: exosortase system-associated protein, TIGR04073 family [Candidatus Omnitrophica bacterium]|nr:exosortase system-associated protein, TIGR04073 family [Candidatus Omnitrophota bacterium]
MNKTIPIAGILFIIFCIAGSVFAGEIDYAKTPLNKLGRGIVNTATCWTAYPDKFAELSKKHDPVVGVTLGLIEGTAKTIVRGFGGLFDILTCLIPPYDKPFIEPEYEAEAADSAMQDYLW